jgi:hypothetical protein
VARHVDAVEAIEQPRQLRGGDRGARVGHGDPHRIGLRRNAHREPGARHRLLESRPAAQARIQYTDKRRTFGDERLLLFYAARLRCRLTTKANPCESRGRKATGLRPSIRACAWMP